MFFVIFLTLFFNLTNYSNCGLAETQNQPKIRITPKIYSNILIRRREEHKLFIRHLLNSEYEKNYKLLELAFDKIFEIIKDNNATLHQSDYNPTSGFPIDERVDSVTLLIENTCLSGEIMLHLPEIAYRILKKHSNWKNILSAAIDFVMNFPDIIQEETVTMLTLFRQEINETQRTEDYINPYYKDIKQDDKKKVKKKKIKKLKKGPQLYSSKKVEL